MELKYKWKHWAVASAILIALAIIANLRSRSGVPTATKAVATHQGQDDGKHADNKTNGTHALNAGAPARNSTDFQKELIAVCEVNWKGMEYQEAMDQLGRLRRAAFGVVSTERRSQLHAFLRTGRDAGTGIALELDERGGISSVGSVRALALDLLGYTELSETEIDWQIYREILSRHTSADEWAIVLRNLAWEGAGNRAWVLTKAHEMIQTPEFLRNPSPGFQEAFDIFVHYGDIAAVPKLAQLVQAGRPELVRPAYVALSRLVERHPEKVLAILNSTSALLAERSNLRADIFGAANLATDATRAQVVTYLRRHDVPIDEKERYLGSIEIARSFVGAGMLAANTRFERMSVRGARAIELLDLVIQDPSLASLHDVAQRATERIAVR